MSGDTFVAPDLVKHKKHKKSKQNGVQDAVLDPVNKGSGEKRKIDSNDDEDKAERKRMKRARKLEKAVLAENASAPVTTLDEDKAERKRLKKARKQERLALENAAMQVDEPDVAPEKKKKRKHVDEAVGPDSAPLKEQKKKSKPTEDAEPVASTSAATSPSPLSAPPKEGKKESKAVLDDAHASASTSAAPSPSPSKKEKKKRSKSSGSRPVSVSLPTAAEAAAFLAKHAITLHNPAEGVPQAYPAFEHLPVPEDLRSAFDGFKEPTPVQAAAWPPALSGRDVVGIAETGSGKTLAFSIPLLARLRQQPQHTGISALVLAPTRELALQTHDALTNLKAPSVALLGGVEKGAQVRALKDKTNRARIVVGTPGRILDLLQEGNLHLSGVEYLVLDEADRMLDQGFENDIRSIIGHAKQGAERQTMMFSATWPEAVRRLASTFLREPVRVTVGSDDLTANSRVEQIVEVFDDARSKDARLLDQLRMLSHKKSTKTGSDEARILVFALYKKEAERVEGMLRARGYAVGALHGDKGQHARMEALERFRSGEVGLLVATDVAARGLDIPNVGAVINYTFPLKIEDYIHRIGRTGRGGRTGKAITFFTGDAHEKALAGELARVLHEGGFEAPGLQKFPMTIKKKEHGAYGAFYRDDIPAPKGPTKIVFD